MQRKLAIKNLTASDLTFFEWQFRNVHAGNQKAINLNADVFIDRLFPSLPDHALVNGPKIPVELIIYGPGDSFTAHRLQRKIIKGSTYKNWRLNGEFVHNPMEESTRYDALKINDLALFEFSGGSFPNTVRLFLISANVATDQELYQHMRNLIGKSSMIATDIEQIKVIIDQISVSEDHPIRYFLLEEELEEFVETGTVDSEKFAFKASKFRISKEDLNQARLNADANGTKGEEFVNYFLEEKRIRRELDSFKWESQENAVSPFDFSVVESGNVFLLDVKSTSGGFERRLHISLNELITMANDPRDYYIYRVFEMKEDTANLRISENLKPFAKGILDVLAGLPEGVKPDGVSVDPRGIGFGEVSGIRIGD